MVFQKEIILNPCPRGFHIITNEIVDILPRMTGIAHIFIKHTSASLTINENADPTVREDFETHFNKMVPENQPYFRHTHEGPDDMPSHIKNVLTETSLVIPVIDGRLALGTWQGIYLWEHRDRASGRSLVVSVW